MRIVGGALRGRRLKGFDHPSIRPTSDRVREAVFNALASRDVFPCAVALDLFAGTGAMGIEALSRGAKRAVFIENDQRAAGLIDANLKALGVESRGIVQRTDAATFIKTRGAIAAGFDVIFIDPPYGAGIFNETLELLDRAGILNPDAVLVAESAWRTAKEDEPALSLLAETFRRRYGDTLIRIYQRRLDE